MSLVTAQQPSFSPLYLETRSAGAKIVAVIAGTAFLALSSHIAVPMVPVPVTMQTFAVTLIGALYGWRLGALTVALWLMQGALGLPVLAPGAAGLAKFVGPTAGYLFAFPLAAALTGVLAERGWNGQRVTLAFVSMLLGNGLCLLVGAAWLSTLVGVEKAIVAGVVPFIVGAVLKAALGAAVLRAVPAGAKA
jgi:biotin transport system substrate-specific component